jgi:hypothetical protein
MGNSRVKCWKNIELCTLNLQKALFKICKDLHFWHVTWQFLLNITTGNNLCVIYSTSGTGCLVVRVSLWISIILTWVLHPTPYNLTKDQILQNHLSVLNIFNIPKNKDQFELPSFGFQNWIKIFTRIHCWF